MFEAIKRRFRDWRARCEVQREDERQRRVRRDLAPWRNQLDTGRCNKCGAAVVVARKAGSSGGDIVCCENQYLRKAGVPFTLNGTGSCVNVADTKVLNERAESIGDPPVEIGDRVRVVEI